MRTREPPQIRTSAALTERVWATKYRHVGADGVAERTIVDTWERAEAAVARAAPEARSAVIGVSLFPLEGRRRVLAEDGLKGCTVFRPNAAMQGVLRDSLGGPSTSCCDPARQAA